MVIDDQWTVVKRIQTGNGHGDSPRSACYKVVNSNGIPFFLKAFDFRHDEIMGDTDLLEKMLCEYNNERRIHELCKDRHLSRITEIKHSGVINDIRKPILKKNIPIHLKLIRQLMLSKSSHYFTAFLMLAFLLSLAGCISGINPTLVQAPSPAKWVDACVDWDDWDKPGPPFRIFGNSYYVGSCGITAILITGNDGHILIDGGTEAEADIIIENIKYLGFSLNDVKLLIHSHEHFDHVAGFAKLQKLSGAKLLASAEAAPVIATGFIAATDPQAGMHKPFPAARVDGIVTDGEVINLGALALTPIATPGHSPGALSWQWESCDKKRCVSIVYADSLSPVSNENYYFSDHPGYVELYQQGLNKIAGLDCQILLTPHPSASKMRDRLSRAEGLIDTNGCVAYAENISKRLKKRLIKEQGERAQ